MNCAQWEERIALSAGGELADPAVERHVEDCPGCRLFASGMRETVEFLHAERDAIGPARYAAVRARVLAEVAGRRRGWMWGWAAAAACAAVAVVAVVQLRTELRVEELPPPALAAIAPPPAAALVRPSPSPATRKVRRVSRTRPEQVLVKVQTSDPDIVIYWIAETKGDLK